MNYNKKKTKKIRVNISLSEDVLFLAREAGIENLSAYIESVLIRKINYVGKNNPEFVKQHNGHYAKLNFLFEQKKSPSPTLSEIKEIVNRIEIANTRWTDGY